MKNNHRLSPHVVPEKYTIQIKPDLEQFIFEGQETISIAVAKPTKTLVLHVVDIEIHSAFWIEGKSRVESSTITYDTKAETATIHFSRNVKGKGKLQLHFAGTIAEQLRGFYRSKYTHQKKDKYLATTQFEATDARRAFPSFDEPAFKATFDLSLVIPKHLKAISNTKEAKVAPHSPGYKVVHFESTPKMSTYLLAYVVGEFEHVQTKTKNGTVIRVHTTPGKKQYTAFSAEVAKRSLEFLENYFNIPFPLPVLDLVAIPDFAAAAMENWGAVTFRETALLVDEKNTPFVNRQRVAEVIAHELVHQWFGNLVTMEWWTHLWLNESFACYMAYLVVDALYPEWHFWTRFVLNEQSFALRADALKSTHPIEVTVNHPDEINEIFDPISYSKGASVLRMLSFYLGPDTFRDGLRLYLKKHSYKNTSSIDLWQDFEKVSGKPIQAMLKNWITKPGYPLITTIKQSGKLHIEQKRFALQKTVDATVWHTPVQSQLTESTTGALELLKQKSKTFSLPEEFSFVKLNPHEQSLYITHYDIASLAPLIIAMKEQALSSIDRLAIVRNALLLAQSGHLSADVYLEIVHQIADTEDSYIVWSEIVYGLSEISTIIHGGKAYSALKEFKKKILSALLERIGYNPVKKESHQVSLLRGLALAQSGLNGGQKAIALANKMLPQLLAGKAISADLRMAVYVISAKHATATTLAKMLARYAKTPLQEERVHIHSAIMFVPPSLLNKVLEFIYSGAVRTQDLPLVLLRGLGYSETKTVMWQSIQKNISSLEKHFAGTKMMGYIFEGATSFTTKKELDRFKKFANLHHGGAKQSIAQTIEQIEINIAWKDRDEKLIQQFLQNLA